MRGVVTGATGCMLLACLLRPSAAPAQAALPNAKPVTGAPYLGEQITETSTVSADGAVARNLVPAIPVYRDSDGRTRVENRRPYLIEVQDPVAGVEYRLDTQRKVAYRVALSKGGLPANRETKVCRNFDDRIFRNSNDPARDGTFRPAVFPETVCQIQLKKAESSLGTKVIGGIQVKGTLTELSEGTEYEVWLSRKLRLPVLTRIIASRIGQTTEIRLNVQPGTPDPALFQPPAGYSIVDLTGGSAR